MANHAKIWFGGVLRPPAATLVLLLSLALLGCSAVKEIARTVSDSSRSITGAVTGGGSGLARRIVVAGVEKTTPAGFAPYFVGTVTERLRKNCRAAVIAAPEEVRVTTPPRLPSGEIDGFALALLGRRQGVNFFVFGTLNDLRFVQEKKGFWWWKDNRYALRAVIRLEIVDAASGSKSLDESFWEEMDMDELRYQQLQDAGPVPLNEVASILEKLMRKAGSRICETVSSEPWQGFVVGADGGRFTISSGAAVGLAAGRTLEVFAKGEAMEGKDGRRYLLAGEKIGEATVAAVTDQTAEAVLNGQGRAVEGGTVRVKR